MYVSGLPFYTEDEALRECFSKFDGFLESTVVRDLKTKQSLGFVTFAKPEEAEAALQKMNGSNEMNGAEIQVNQVTLFKVFVATPGSGTLFFIKHAHPKLTEGRRGGRAFSLEAG